MKTRILFIPSSMNGGCYYYRCYSPMKAIIEKCPEDFDITIDAHWTYTDLEKDEIGKSYDIVFVHQALFTEKFQDEFWKTMLYCKKEYGTIFILDIDDYWEYHKNHPAYKACIFNAYPQKMMMNFKLFDYVTTTTEYFKEEISKFFPEDKVIVFENAISLNDKQFSSYKEKSEKLRLGITGGSSHTEDIKQILEFAKYLNYKQLDDIEIVFCGYDTKNAKKVVVNQDGKIIKEERMPDAENWWVKTENKLKQESKNYERIEAKNIVKGEFGKIYEHIDVLLVPLVNNKFNRCKSELKFIEAGFTHTAVISSKVIPYSNYGEDGKDCILVKEAEPQAWAKAVKKLLRDKSLLEKITIENEKKCRESRNLEKITEKRIMFLKSLKK